MKTTRPLGGSGLKFSALFILLCLGQARADIGQPALNHRMEQGWPIALGTSGGNINDRSLVYCCSGTLGGLVQKNGFRYILSNNHVLARVNQGAVGEPINQPGQIDQGCQQDGVVANLSEYVPIQFGKGRKFPVNYVDAAIAQIASGAVRDDGAIIDIGSVNAATLAPAVGQSVQKSGRTTGWTAGNVSSIAVSVKVGYSKSCGGAANQVALFNDQILINSTTFSAGGDSGSLVVEVPPIGSLERPRSVGLLFAGSSTTTILNPIDKVLSALGVSMVPGTAVGAAPTPPIVTGAAAPADATFAASLEQAKKIKERHSKTLFDIPDVAGHGVGVSEDGQPVIEVYLTNPNGRGRVPASLENVPIRVVITDEFVAY